MLKICYNGYKIFKSNECEEQGYQANIKSSLNINLKSWVKSLRSSDDSNLFIF